MSEAHDTAVGRFLPKVIINSTLFLRIINFKKMQPLIECKLFRGLTFRINILFVVRNSSGASYCLLSSLVSDVTVEIFIYYRVGIFLSLGWSWKFMRKLCVQ